MMLLLTLLALAPSAGAVKGAPALRATAVAPEAPHALVAAKSTSQSTGPLDSCGKVATYENAKPKNHADAMETKFNEETKKREAVTFGKGDEVVYKCVAGFTVDGSKDGETEFKAACSDMGYFKPDGVCVKASKCGAVPVIDHATATPKKVEGAVQFACNPGYSLDGEKVVAGGAGANSLFTLKCVEFNNEYEKFKGECTNYAFVASKESTRMYNEVFEALFVVTCKGKLTTAFGKGKAAPVDAACAKLKAPGASADCAGLVADIKSEFDTKKAALKDDSKKKEWYETEGKPGVGDKSMKFCQDLWKLVEKPNEF
jgi:hypothetical protein